MTIDPVENKSLSYNHIVSGLGCTYLTRNWDVRAVPAGACEATAQASTPKSSASNSTPTDDPETVDSSNSSESDPTSASGGSSGSNQDEIQKKCSDLKTGGGNGNSDPCSKQAKGFVFVQECNMFVPSGKAKGSGLTIIDMDGDGNADKKKDILDQMCNQSKSSASSSTSGKSSTSQSSNANAGSSTSSTPTSTGSGQGGNIGSGGNGGGGSGGGTGGGSNNKNEPNPEETNGGNDANFETPVPQEVTITKQDGTTTTIDMNNVDNTIKECKSYNTKKDKCNNYEKKDISKYDCQKYHVDASGKVDYCIEKKKEN